MAVKTLDQVLAELNPTYQPQIDTLRQRQSSIPGQIQEGEKQLGAKQEQAFGDILSGARRRGLGFSGIPLSEQAKYTSTEFLPALARLRQSGQEQAMSLEDAINQILERRNTLGQQLVQQSYQQDLEERKFAEEQRLNNLRIASAGGGGGGGGGYSPSLGGGGGGGATASAVRRADGGFNFTNEYGNPISAAAYAQLTKMPFRDLLQKMAREGDKGAQSALGFVGNDFGYDPNKIGSAANIYNSLVWGVRPGATRATPRSGGGGW